MAWNPFKRKEKKSSASSKTFLYEVGRAIWSKERLKTVANDAYRKNIIAYYCIDLIATHASRVPWKLFKGGKEVQNHKILDLLQRPNEFESKSDFFERDYTFYLYSGNSYMEAAYLDKERTIPKQEPPQWLYSLRPDRFQIFPGDNGMPSHYRYTRGLNYFDFDVSITGQTNLLHSKTVNPLDDWYGMPPVTAAAYAVDQHNASNEHNYNLLINGCRPSGALKILDEEGKPRNLDDQQFADIEERVISKFTGPQNAKRPMILEGGATWEPMSLNPVEMDFINLKKMSARDIALAYKVPMDLLNTEQAKYNNMQAANEQLWENAIIPLVLSKTDSLNMWLLPKYKEQGLVLVPDFSNVSALIPRRERQRKSIDKLSYLTINEKRAIEGKEPLAGGDQILIQANMVPLDRAGELLQNNNTVDSKKEAYVSKLIKEDHLDEKTAKSIGNIMFGI